MMDLPLDLRLATALDNVRQAERNSKAARKKYNDVSSACQGKHRMPNLARMSKEVLDAWEALTKSEKELVAAHDTYRNLAPKEFR